MVLVHFTPEFSATAEKAVTEWKNANTDAADALRALEKLCASSGEEFHPDGTPLVEKIYEGKFDGGQANSFAPNAAPAIETSTATPISGTVAETSTSTGIGVDAPAVSTTPETRFHQPSSESIASKAATPTPFAPEAPVATEVPTSTPDTTK